MKRLSHAVLLATAVVGCAASVSAGATFAYSFTTNTGYTGAGEFSYNAATAPAVIVESGSGPTTTLQSLSLAVFSPSSALLDSGSAVSGGVSSSPYLGFEYDTATLALILLDNNTSSSGNDVSYFVSNYVDHPQHQHGGVPRSGRGDRRHSRSRAGPNDGLRAGIARPWRAARSAASHIRRLSDAGDTRDARAA
jgi:hypothetical protein